MNLNECESEFAAKFPFWDKLTVEEKANLAERTTRSVFEKGANIHGDNSRCTGGILVRSGCVRVYILSEDGREITLYRLYSGDICMLSASCVLSAITFDVIVDAEEESEVLVVGGAAFKELCDRHIEAENFALNVAVSRFSEVMWVMQQILFMSFDRRLALFLLDESAKNGSSDIKLTHDQIARYIGSAREVVSRMLKYFSSEGIITLYRGGISITDRERLAALSRKH